MSRTVAAHRSWPTSPSEPSWRDVSPCGSRSRRARSAAELAVLDRAGAAVTIRMDGAPLRQPVPDAVDRHPGCARIPAIMTDATRS